MRATVSRVVARRAVLVENECRLRFVALNEKTALKLEEQSAEAGMRACEAARGMHKKILILTEPWFRRISTWNETGTSASAREA